MHFASLQPSLGHAIRNAAARAEWISMLEEAAEYIDRENLAEEILFHGTSKAKARSILRDGMRPTDAFEENLTEGDVLVSGSFWGTLKTAAWYAEDTAANRRGGAPTIIACPRSFIGMYATLHIDIPTRDMPVPGLMSIDDASFVERWSVGQRRDWRDSLADLGSCTALHDYDMPLDPAVIFDGIESLERILDDSAFSP